MSTSRLKLQVLVNEVWCLFQVLFYHVFWTRRQPHGTQLVAQVLHVFKGYNLSLNWLKKCARTHSGHLQRDIVEQKGHGKKVQMSSPFARPLVDISPICL